MPHQLTLDQLQPFYSPNLQDYLKMPLTVSASQLLSKDYLTNHSLAFINQILIYHPTPTLDFLTLPSFKHGFII
jgi:hypothetical protein